MDWILLSVLAYFFLAIESVANKFLITGKVKSWRLYLFYIGLLSFFSLILAPFGFAWPGWKIFLAAVISGVIFFGYLMLLFSSLKNSSATRVFILVGAGSTLVTFILSRLFLGEQLETRDIMGVIFLLVGGYFISYKFYKRRFFSHWKSSFLAGMVMGLSLVILKWAFDAFAGHNFITVYLSSRVGIVLATGAMIFLPSFRKKIFFLLKKRKKKKQASQFGAIILVKSLAGGAALIINWSIQEGSVTIVNALASVQYLFVFILSMILGVYFKDVLQEKLEARNTAYKAIGSALVVVGIFLVLI